MADYNGWANYETWLVNLWLGDDFAATINEADPEIATNQHELAEAMQEWTANIVDLDTHSVESGFIADLINAALSRVNWHEIAENHVREEEAA